MASFFSANPFASPVGQRIGQYNDIINRILIHFWRTELPKRGQECQICLSNGVEIICVQID